MRIDILTLFPDTVHAVLHESILGRAAAKDLIEINCVQIRDYTENRQNQVDDYPYGGGWGCVLMAQPLQSCLDAVMKNTGGMKNRVIYMSPQGKPFTQEDAKRLSSSYDHLVLVCGHYEGVDERFIEKSVDEEISLGDFVLTGGEIAAMAVSDAVCRLVPGVLADEQCFTDESHWDGLLEYPQYTRPEVWEGMEVPEVLREGNHAKITRWRRKQQLIRTKQKRPDLFEKLHFDSREDLALLSEIEKETASAPLTAKLLCRAALQTDLPELQRVFPDERDFSESISAEECFLLLSGTEIAGCYVLTAAEDPSYAGIRDGKWTEGVPGCVLRCFAVAEAWRDSDLDERMLKSAAQQAEAMGFRCIRTDIDRKNKRMQKLLRDSGYRYRGNLCTDVSSDGVIHALRQAYEKIWKGKRTYGTDEQQ